MLCKRINLKKFKSTFWPVKRVCKIESLRIEIELTRRGREDYRNKRVERMTDRRRKKERERLMSREVWDGEKVQ